jgi:hypothetical protein
VQQAGEEEVDGGLFGGRGPSASRTRPTVVIGVSRRSKMILSGSSLDLK